MSATKYEVRPVTKEQQEKIDACADNHDWDGPPKNIWTCKSCGINSLAPETKKALEEFAALSEEEQKKEVERIKKLFNE